MSGIRLSAFTLLLATTAIAPAADPILESIGMWSGKVGDESLRKLAPKAGFIGDRETWTVVWKVWRPGEGVPKINFDETLVLVGTVPGPNMVLLTPTSDEANAVRFVVGGTKVGGPGFGYKLVAIPKEGVTSVNGKPVNGEVEESIHVEVIGKLRTGLFAIGGETTGTTITAKGVTWELDFGKNAKLRKLAESLDGKLVRVEGSLERRPGVEIRERWIVAVERLEAASRGE